MNPNTLHLKPALLAGIALGLCGYVALVAYTFKDSPAPSVRYVASGIAYGDEDNFVELPDPAIQAYWRNLKTIKAGNPPVGRGPTHTIQ